MLKGVARGVLDAVGVCVDDGVTSGEAPDVLDAVGVGSGEPSAVGVTVGVG